MTNGAHRRISYYTQAVRGNIMKALICTIFTRKSADNDIEAVIHSIYVSSPAPCRKDLPAGYVSNKDGGNIS